MTGEAKRDGTTHAVCEAYFEYAAKSVGLNQTALAPEAVKM